MKLSRRQLIEIIREALDVHQVPVDLDTVDSEEAYGIGYMKGKEHAWEEDLDAYDVVPREDAWSAGDNLDAPCDYARLDTGESNAGPHVTISERKEA